MAYYASRQHGAADALARGLGWLSIGLGMAELLAPQALGRALGMERQARLIQLYGLREVAAGVGILAADDPTPWIWGRVAGDALDIATLVPHLDEENPERRNVGRVIGVVAGVTLLDLLCAQQLSMGREPVPLPDYSGRSGFPDAPERMRGAALTG